MTPQLVSHYAADAVFEKAAPLLAKALGTHTAWTLPELATLCSNRGAFLFCDDPMEPRNAMVGRFEVWGGNPVFHCIAMAGGEADWIEAMATIQDFAANFGVKRIVFSGRKGWQRVFPKARVIYQAYEISEE